MFVDGFVASVPRENREAFLEMARKTGDWFRKQGALRCVENWEADVPDGEVTSFPLAVQRKDGEAIVFSWIEWPSKEVRDTAMSSMRDAPEFADMDGPMPFDGKRLIFGGFENILDEKA